MTADAQAAREDLAFLRGLVDEDWRPGLRFFGATYAAIGAAIFAQVAVQWAVDTGLLALPDGAILIWIVLVWGVYTVVQTLLPRWMPAARAVGLRNRVTGGAFIGMIASHLTMLAVFVIVAVRTESPILVPIAALSFFAMQGGMWIVFNAIRPGRGQLAHAFGWLAAALGCAFLIGSPHFAGAIGLVALALMVAPGLSMMRAARAPD